MITCMIVLLVLIAVVALVVAVGADVVFGVVALGVIFATIAAVTGSVWEAAGGLTALAAPFVALCLWQGMGEK